MITYILETLAFQLVFLLTYDLFLKNETFFQWNRLYLLATFALSILLPWVKIEALKSSMPESLGTATIYLTQLDGIVLGPEGVENSFWELLPWYYWVLIMGSLVATLWFGYKLLQIGRLRRKGQVVYFSDFTKVTVEQSTLAFSFFRNIFLGEQIQKDKEQNIIAHELVHVKQRHSLDLLFFELARIVFWFNPLVYVYQNRMAELHEFIADAQAVKHNKKEHFEMLLSEAFNTQHISFVNQFFNKSLIKKRIVMLQKKRSKAVWQLKYVLLLPLVLGMLVYTSCESESESKTDKIGVVPDKKSVEVSDDGENNIVTLKVGDIGALTEDEKYKRDQLLEELRNSKEVSTLEIVDRKNIRLKMTFNSDDSIANEGVVSIPFGVIDEVPVFPGCENAVDKKACFQEKMREHIRKHFNYPQEAQEKGIQGRVALLFHINSKGEIMDIKSKGPSPILEREALRIINRLPKMTPGKQDGKSADAVFSIPITFRLQSVNNNTVSNSKFAKDYIQVSGSLMEKNGISFYQGKVMDSESLGLPGVNVSVQGLERGVVSNFDGMFTIEVKNNDVLKFQYKGLPDALVEVSK